MTVKACWPLVDPVTLEFGILLKKSLTLQVTFQQLVLELCYKYITQDVICPTSTIVSLCDLDLGVRDTF